MVGSSLPDPSFSRFPLSRIGPTPAHLITTAAALRLRHLLRPHCLRLGFLFRSSFKKLAHLAHAPRLDFYWFVGAPPLKGISLPSHDFSADVSSYFFGGEETGKVSRDERMSHSEAPKRNSLRGRRWTNVLIAINLLVFIGQAATQGKLLLWGAKINSLIEKGQFWRLATSSFLHANIAHLAVNCFSLNSVGPTVENLCGAKRYLAIYMTSAITSSLMSYWLCKGPSVGASGAIFGLVGSVAVFLSRHRSLIGDGKGGLQHIALIIASSMVMGSMSKGIDNWGHFGGFLGGVATSWFLGPAWKYELLSKDGRTALVDRAPIFYLAKRKRERKV